MKRALVMFLLIVALLPLMANPQWDEPQLVRSSAIVDYNGASASFADGSTIFVWSDVSSGDRDVYAMHVLANGQNAWDAPLPVTSHSGDQDHPVLVKISETDVVISYYDYSESEIGIIKAQRINLNAEILWNANGIIVCNADAAKYQLKAYYNANYIYVIWDDLRMSQRKVFGQKIALNGSTFWTNAGKQLTYLPFHDQAIAFHGDSNGFTLIYHTITYVNMVVMQYYNHNGDLQTSVPIVLFNTDLNCYYQDSYVDNELYVVVKTSTPLSHQSLYLLRFNSTLQSLGTPLWITDVSSSLVSCQIVPGNPGELILFWNSNYDSNFYICRTSTEAEIITPPTLCDTAAQSQRRTSVLSDGMGGLLVSWINNMNYTYDSEIGLMRIGTDNTPLWSVFPINTESPISNSFSRQGNTVRMVWGYNQSRSSGIKLQDFTLSGTPLYQEEGLSVNVGMSGIIDQGSLKVFHNEDETFLIWSETDLGIFYQVLNTDGNPLLEPNGRFLSNCNNAFETIQTPEGNIAVIWSHSPFSGMRTVYTQMIDYAGSLLWGQNHILLCTDNNIGAQLGITHNDGAIICAWNGGSESRQTYIQRISEGIPQWGNGIQISADIPGTEYYLNAIRGQYLVFSEVSIETFNSYLMVCKINSEGSPVWNPPYMRVIEDLNSQYAYQILTDAVLLEQNLYLSCRNMDESTFRNKAYVLGITPEGTRLGGDLGYNLQIADEAETRAIYISAWQDDISFAHRWENSTTDQDKLEIYRFDHDINPLWMNPTSISENDINRFNPIGRLDDGRFFTVYRNYIQGDYSPMYYTLINPSGSTSISAIEMPGIDQTIERNISISTVENSAYFGFDRVGLRKHIEHKEHIFDFRGLHVQRYDFEPLDVEDTPLANNGILLSQNYPNPFNPSTTISYELETNKPVELAIYNMRGQLVKTLIKQNQNKGKYQVTWDGKDENKHSVSSGVYFFKLRSGKFSSSKKMILMK